MFDDVLIESGAQHRQRGGPLTAAISILVHLGFIAAIVAAGYHVREKPTTTENRIRAFLVTQTARPAPPPPPPPPMTRSSGTSPQRRVTVEMTEPRETFRQPAVIPHELPAVPDMPGPPDDTPPLPGAMPGGVPGGIEGGIVGGQVGGDRNGRLGGVVGGSGSGSGTDTTAEAGPGEVPIRVGGNVKAPQLVVRIDPLYTEAARIARIQGMVIIEAVIDRKGNVTEARILKSLPLGLDQSALQAIRQWRFKPGTLNGNPVPVLYNLTVQFHMN
jgi:periplasmic protein TonB